MKRNEREEAQTRVVLDSLADNIRRSVQADKLDQAAHFAAQAHNILNPDRAIAVPEIQEKAK